MDRAFAGALMLVCLSLYGFQNSGKENVTHTQDADAKQNPSTAPVRYEVTGTQATDGDGTRDQCQEFKVDVVSVPEIRNNPERQLLCGSARRMKGNWTRVIGR